MKIVGINTFNHGSTGNIMINILNTAEKLGHETYISCVNADFNRKKKVKNQIFIGSKFEYKCHVRLGVYTGLIGCFSFFATQKFLKKLDEIKPDILHLHNLHGWYINLPMLFKWIKKNNIKVIWTLHDCWTFTGSCPHFEMLGCDKWKTGCYSCKYKGYPQSKIDNSRYMYNFKKEWFTGIRDMMIVTPSGWLADLVKQSFLKEYEVRVINNGIDLNVFKPVESNLRETLNLENKFIILGCADSWGQNKGLDVFIELANKLDYKYKIILVGTNDIVDKQLPDSIISIHKTQDQTELAKYYTIADVFVNPTREDNFPTVNLEALACGTPVITFDTGGSPECIDESCGIVVHKDNFTALKEAVEFVGKVNPFSREICIDKALNYNMNSKFEEYIKLYNRGE